MKDITLTLRSDILKISSYDLDLKEGLKKALTFRVLGYQFTKAHKKHNWDGKKSFLFGNSRAPVGCHRRVSSYFKKLGLKVKVVFEEDFHSIKSEPLAGIEELFPYQESSVDRALKHRFGIIDGAIRSGKTVIIASLLARTPKAKTWVLTSTVFGGKELVHQTHAEIQKFLPDKEIGYLLEGEFKDGNIIVSSYGALRSALFAPKKVKSEAILARNVEVAASVTATDFLILDECHHIFTEPIKKSLEKFSNIKAKIGLSGTPKPDKVAQVELEAAIGPIVRRVGYEELIKSKRLAQPKIILYNLPEDWYEKFLEEYRDVYRSNISENIFRNKFIAFLVDSFTRKGLSVFVIVRMIEQGDMLHSYLPGSVFLRGEIESETRRLQYSELEKGKLGCIIATIGKEGLNLPHLDVVINAEGGKSNVSTVQRMRSLTAAEGKEYGYVVDFADKGTFLEDHSELRKQKYSNLPGFLVVEKDVPKKMSKVLEERYENA